MSFKQEFFKIYDRKTTSGEITFNQTGIKKIDFTRLCMEENYVFDAETLEMLAYTMKLTEDERELLMRAAEETQELAEQCDDNDIV